MGRLTSAHVIGHIIVLIFGAAACYQGMVHLNRTAMAFGLISVGIGLTSLGRFLGQQDILRERQPANTTKEN